MYSILAAASVTGAFAGVTDPFVFLDTRLSYTPTEVLLTLTQLPFNSAAQTPNQIAVANALQAGGVGSVLGSAVFNLATAEPARAAFDALSGEVHGSLQSALITDSGYVRNAVLGRLRAGAYQGEGGDLGALGYADPALAYAAKAAFPVKIPFKAPPPEPELAFWAQGFGAWGRIESDGNAAEVKRNLAGFVTGFDRRFGDWQAGLAAGYSRSNVDVDARASGAAIDSAHLAAYAGARFGAFSLRSGAAFAWHEIDVSRTIAFPGFFDRTSARYDGDTAQVFGEVGYGLALGGVAVEPFAGLAYVHLRTAGFAESRRRRRARSAPAIMRRRRLRLARPARRHRIGCCRTAWC